MVFILLFSNLNLTSAEESLPQTLEAGEQPAIQVEEVVASSEESVEEVMSVEAPILASPEESPSEDAFVASEAPEEVAEPVEALKAEPEPLVEGLSQEESSVKEVVTPLVEEPVVDEQPQLDEPVVEEELQVDEPAVEEEPQTEDLVVQDQQSIDEVSDSESEDFKDEPDVNDDLSIIDGVASEVTPELEEDNLLLNNISALALGEYFTDDNTVLLTLTGSSINSHSLPRFLWIQDGMIYVAVEAIQTSYSMILNTTKNEALYTLQNGQAIKIDGQNYPLTYSHPNAYWSVFTFPVGALTLSDPTQKYKVTLQGDGGHGVPSEFTIEIPKVTVNVNKTWKDGPMSPVTIKLERQIPDEEWVHVSGMDVQLTATDGKASYTWQNLSYVDNAGRIYTYRIVEANPGEGYTVSHDDPIYNSTTYTYTFSITNTYKPPVFDVIATKTWVGGPITDHSATINLYRNIEGEDPALVEGVTPIVTGPVGEPPVYTYTWKDMPKTDMNGNLFTYSVAEDGVVEGKVTIGDNEYTVSQDGFAITNTYVIPLTDASVSKVWVNETGENNPDSVTAILLQNGVKYKEITLNAENNWTYTWKDLPKTNSSGVLYAYTVDEVEVPGYKKSVEGSLITNSRDVTSQDVSKVWVNQTSEPNPTSVTALLLRNGENYKEIVLNADNNWAHTWTNLPESDLNGNAYTYTVDELAVPGYTKSIEGSAITNTRILQSIEVSKTWLDESGGLDQPTEIVIELYQNGGETPYDTLTLTGEGWKGTFDNLPQYDLDGKAYIYTIIEIIPAGYESVVEEYSVTNTRILTTVVVTKTWNSVEGETQPEAITIRLYRDGTEINSVVLTSAPWSYSFESDKDGNGLPKTNPTTEVDYAYTVTEDPVTGYDTVIEGLSITNTQQTVEQAVSKAWVNETDEADPIQVTALLLRDGEEYKRVELSNANEWKHVWTNLPKTDSAGVSYVYTVDELDVSGYSKAIDGAVITNTRLLKTVNVEKIWEDQDGTFEHADTVTIELYQDDSTDPYDQLTLQGPDWKGMFENLPLQDLVGKVHTYTIKEVDTAPFVAVIDGNDEEGFVVTNYKPTFTVDKTADVEKYHKAGDVITYTVEVVNTGKVPVLNLQVEDSLVSFNDMTVVENVQTNGDLDVGETWTLTYTYVVTEEDIVSGGILNAVVVTNPKDPEYPEEDDKDIFKPKFTVEKSSIEETFVNEGDDINFEVVITNTGKIAIENLVIEDTLVPLDDMTLVESITDDGVLDIGETWALTYIYTVNLADVERGYVLNRVTVTDPENPDNPEEDEDDVPLNPKPGLTVVKTSKEQSFKQVGDSLHYTVVVTNTGNMTLRDLVVNDTLVDFKDMTLVESKLADGDLQIDEIWTLTYEYKVTQEDLDRGSVLNVVTVTNPKNPSNPIGDEVEVPAEKKPAFTVDKTAEQDKFKQVGDEIDYTVVITNTGNVTVEELTVIDSLVNFEDMKLVESISEDGKLEVGETWTLTYTYQVKEADVKQGNVYNVVSVKCPPCPEAVTDEVKVPYEAPKKELPSTGIGSNGPLLVTGLGLLMAGDYLRRRRKRED